MNMPDKIRLISILFRIGRPHRRLLTKYFFAFTILLLLEGFVQVASAYNFGHLFSSITAQPATPRISVYLSCVAFFLWAILAYFSSLHIIFASKLREIAFIEYTQRGGFGYISHTSGPSGHAKKPSVLDLNRFNEDLQAITGVLVAIPSILQAIIVLICAIITSLLINIWLSIVIILLVPVYSFFLIRISTRVSERYLSASEATATASSFHLESIQGYGTLASLNSTGFRNQEYIGLQFKRAREMLHAGRLSSLLQAASSSSANFVAVVVIIFTVIASFYQPVSVASLITVNTMILYLWSSGQNIVQSIVSINKVSHNLDRFCSSIQSASDMREDRYIYTPARKVISLSLTSVSLSYSSMGPTVLANVTVEFNSGDRVLVEGVNGSGKSSLARLIAGVLKPTTGKIEIRFEEELLDPCNVGYPTIAYIDQHPTIFEGSFQYNASLGRHWMPENLINNDLISVGLMSRAESNAQILPNGENISGGERQRLALARVISSNPSIVIFDESFSAIDLAARKELMIIISKKLPNAIIIVISHDTSPAGMVFNKKLLLRDGCIYQN